MKSLMRIVFSTLLFVSIPLSYVSANDDVSVADDVAKEDVKEPVKKKSKLNKKKKPKALSLDAAKKLVFSKGTAADAVKGAISKDPKLAYYDLYARQMAYRENAKELRSSLEARRKNFEVPRVAALEDFRETQPKIYNAESAAYNKEMHKKKRNKNKSKLKKKKKPSITEGSSVQKKVDKVASADAPKDNDVGLTEQDIPMAEGEEAKKKKVVTSEDAPDFDPSNL